MGKLVVCADHPSNDFFKQYPNCRTYNNSTNDFVGATLKALSEEPMPLTDDQRHELSWEAATNRFLRAADLNKRGKTSSEKSIPSSGGEAFMSISLRDLRRNLEDASAYMHYVVSGNEAARCAFGAIPRTLQPDEQQRKELGLPPPPPVESSRH